MRSLEVLIIYLIGVVAGMLVMYQIKFKQAHAFQVYICNFTTQEQLDQVHNIFDVQRSKLCTEWFGGRTEELEVKLK